MAKEINTIGVLTSGGDAPGMNAAIRAVVREAIAKGKKVKGIKRGYAGLLQEEIIDMEAKDVSDIIQRGGTILQTARCMEFTTAEGQKRGAEICKKHGIDGIIVIGGDGSYMGAKLLTEEHGFPCVGIPGTIDNDVAGTDYTIGYETALQTAVDAIDRLRDTSSSHQRISIVEIMGRHCSDLTISAGIAGGCEYIVASEMEFNREELIRQIERSIIRGKRHAIIAITELITDVHSLAREIETRVGHETRATVLGHIQRGGSPCAFDRILGSRMGVYAVDILLQGKGGYCVGIQNEKLVHHDIIDAINNMRREFKADWLEMAKRLE